MHKPAASCERQPGCQATDSCAYNQRKFIAFSYQIALKALVFRRVPQKFINKIMQCFLL